MSRQVIILNATREAVERGDTSEVADILSDFTRYLMQGDERDGSCIAIGIYGYENDPREIYQIPHARRWWQLLEKQFPHLMYFLTPLMDQYTLYALCLLPSTLQQGQPTIDSDQLINFVTQRLNYLGYLFQQIGLRPHLVAKEIGESYGFEIDADLFYSDRYPIASQPIPISGLEVGSSPTETRYYDQFVAGLSHKETRLLCAKELCASRDEKFIAPVLAALKVMTWSEAEDIAGFLPLFGLVITPHLIEVAQKGKKSSTAAAIRSLGLIGGKQAAEALVERLITLPTKSEPTEALVTMSSEAVPFLKPLLTHAKADVRAMAAFALGKIGDKSSLSLLEQLADEDRSEKVQGVAYNAASWIRADAICNVDLRSLFGDIPAA